MKTAISITLIIAGASLILAPMIIEYLNHSRTEGEAVTISITGKKPWGSTAAMSIGTVIIGVTALLSVRKQKYEEPVYVHKDHKLGQVEPSIRGDLQYATKTPSIPIQSLDESKPEVDKTADVEKKD